MISGESREELGTQWGQVGGGGGEKARGTYHGGGETLAGARALGGGGGKEEKWRPRFGIYKLSWASWVLAHESYMGLSNDVLGFSGSIAMWGGVSSHCLP